MILLIGDLHFKHDNIYQTTQYYEEIKNVLSTKAYDIDYTILLGDILHTHDILQIAVMNRAISFIDMISTFTPVFILAGNHDMVNNQSFCDESETWLTVLKNKHNCTIVTHPQIHSLCDLKCAMFPFIPKTRFNEACKLYNIDLNNVDYCFAHQEFKDCKMGCIKSEDGDEYIWNAKCFSGHIHEYQTVCEKITYTGSAFEHSFSSPTCFYFLLDKTSLIKIPTKTKSKHTTYVKLENLNLENLKKDGIPQLNKLVIKCDSIEDFNLWLKKNEELKKYYKIECDITIKSVVKNTNKKTILIEKLQNSNLLDYFEDKFIKLK